MFLFFLLKTFFVLKNAQGDLELDSDNENVNTFKIEPTKAEEEALSRGLQVPYCSIYTIVFAKDLLGKHNCISSLSLVYLSFFYYFFPFMSFTLSCIFVSFFRQ